MSKFGVIFDMDGTLVDNMPYHMRAFRTFVDRHGIRMDDAEFLARINGKTNDDIMRILFGDGISADQILAYSNEKESLYRELYRPHLSLSKGLERLLVELHEHGILLGVGSSAPDENINFVLDGLGIRHYFSAVINASQISRGKPDPEVFLRAASVLGLDPARCVVVEDAVSGIAAAHNAEMRVIAIAQIMSREALSGADLVIDDFTQVNVRTFEHLLSS
jgi:beta-phosphoglucomutase family hydrolase